MILPDVNAMAIPEGRVRKILKDGDVMWMWAKGRPVDVYALATNNWYVNLSGGHSAIDTNWLSADYVPAAAGSVVRFGLLGHSSVATVGAYDSNKKIIGYARYTAGTQGWLEGEYVLPEGTAFITITGCTEKYKPDIFPRQYTVMLPGEQVNEPPQYVTDGLILWCDGINNTGVSHSDDTSTWKDLSGHDNDIISTKAKDATTPESILQGEWKANGAYINAKSNQFLRTVNQFDLGVDRTIEVRFTLLADVYATFGFATGDRYKYRITSGGEPVKDWIRTSESDTSNIITVYLQTSAMVGVPATMCITRRYNAETDKTEYLIYFNGALVGSNNQSGNHRAGDVSHILLGNESDNAIFHSVRLYDRALTGQEVGYNYEYDRLRFVKEG